MGLIKKLKELEPEFSKEVEQKKLRKRNWKRSRLVDRFSVIAA
jgi:hypothetical protein